MESFSDLNFSPEIKVVDAVDSLKGSRYLLFVSILVFGLFGVLLGAILTSKTSIAGFWAWLLLLVLVLIQYALLKSVLRSIKLLGQRKTLKQTGITTEATIVGRVLEEGNETEDTFTIYYQFRPDFVVRHIDGTPSPRLFKLPMGAALPILFLSEKPEVTGIVQ
jgi:hypothetical protein